MSTKVLARFYVVSLERVQWYNTPPGEALRVKLAAVQGEPFGPATPQGSLDMLIVNPAAAAVFHEAKIGQMFDLLFTRHDEE
jgi:hypothetical protein